jgi:hypothetical protein
MIGPKVPGLRERILVFGREGSGKSYSWLTIARLHRQKGSGARFYVIDTDDAIPRMLAEEFEDVADIVTVYPAFRWPQYESAIASILQEAKPGDWLVVDMIDRAWSSVQEHFSSEVYGQDFGSFLLEVRKEARNPREAWTAIAREQMWQIVSRLYREWEDRVIFESPTHVYATASVSVVDKDTPDEVKRLFPGGIMPAGHRKLGHAFHTVLLAYRHGSEYRMDTIKDRGRKPLEAEIVTSFALGYLIKVAGWRV